MRYRDHGGNVSFWSTYNKVDRQGKIELACRVMEFEVEMYRQWQIDLDTALREGLISAAERTWAERMLRCHTRRARKTVNLLLAASPLIPFHFLATVLQAIIADRMRSTRFCDGWLPRSASTVIPAYFGSCCGSPGGNNMVPLVSVLIITYNQQDYIAEAVTSAASQDYPELEVIVADDASSDATPQIIRRLAAEFPPGRVVPVINARNLGITANSNVGLARCRGDLIAFMGGDDVLLPGKIRRQVEWFMADKHRVLCGHDADWIEEKGAPLGLMSSDHRALAAGRGIGGMIRHGNLFPATSVMVRRDRLPPYGFDASLPVVSDWKLWLDIIGRDGEYGYIDGIWARYRRHSANVSRGISRALVHDVLLTAFLVLKQYRGRYLLDWCRYFAGYAGKRLVPDRTAGA